MKAIIKAKMQETEIDYTLMGLYSHEEYVGRIMVLKELLKELDAVIDNAVDKQIEESQDVKILQSYPGYLANL